ncbi:MAG: VWA domain-containing protein [Gemmatimonadota bacterium]
MLVAAVALTGALVFAARARQRAYVTAGAEEVPLRVLLAVDLSPSMTVEDVPPSRFIQARLAANRLLPEVPEADVGLLVFGGYAALVVPPTPDRRLLRDYLEALRPDERAGDTDLASAIRAGTGALVGGRIPGHEGRPSSRSWLVLFTDGEGFEEEAARLKAIELASEKGVRVAVVTLGTPEGGALPGKPNVRSRAFPNRFRGLPGSGAPPPKAVFAIARQIQEEDAHGGPSASPLDRVEGRDPLGRLLAVAALLALAGEWMMGLRGRVPI